MNRDTPIQDIFLRELQKAVQRADAKNLWVGSPFEEMRTRLQIDNRGEVGERFVAAAMKLLGRDVEHSGKTDAANKHWDVRCDGIDWEVKTATLTKGTLNFQHEGVQKTRRFHGIIFVDIAPQDIFATFVPKSDIRWKARAMFHRGIKVSRPLLREKERRKGSYLYKIDLKMSALSGCKMESLSDFDAALRKAEERIRSARGQAK